MVTGGELYEHIIKHKMFGEAKTAEIIKQVLLAVNYMHLQNIVHRDLKPENLLIQPIPNTEEIIIKLTDFGFATICNPVKGLSQVLGSPMYMAPELVLEKSYNAAVDIWSIGVITHILLSGCPPFYGKEKKDIQRAILSAQPNFGRVKQKLSNQAIDFTLKCLNKDSSQRPSAKELLSHPFILDNITTTEIDSEVALQIASDLTAYYKLSVFQSGIVSLLANMQAQQSELNSLKKMFLTFDSNQDGFLSLDELTLGMTRVFGQLKA
jgi:calcium-dependent protein kinase